MLRDPNRDHRPAHRVVPRRLHNNLQRHHKSATESRFPAYRLDYNAVQRTVLTDRWPANQPVHKPLWKWTRVILVECKKYHLD